MAKKNKKRVAVPEETKRQVLVEAGYRCSVPRCPNDVSLEVHHIDYDRDNHDPANLLVLCSNCHGRATRKEIDRKACLMIKDLLRLQKSSKSELEEVKDEIIGEMRSLVGSQEVAKPLVEKERGTQRPNGRIQVATSQAMVFGKANVALPTDVLRPLMASLYWSGEILAALEIQRIVMRSGTPTATDHYNLGVLLGETGKEEEAEEAYRKALDIDPKNAEAWYNLAVLLGETERKVEAEEAYHKALSIDREHDRAWSNLGNLVKVTGRTEEAEKAYHRALDADPKSAITWCNLGILLHQTDRKETAEEAYRKAIELDPHYAPAWSVLAILLQEAGRKEEAAEAQRKAIEAGEHNAEQHNSLAYLLWECGRFEDAELEVMEALKDNADYAYAHATLGLLRLEQNDLDAGQQGYEKAIGLAPDNKDLQQKYHYEYGRALGRNGRVDEARKEFEAGLKLNVDYVRKQIEAELAKLGEVDGLQGNRNQPWGGMVATGEYEYDVAFSFLSEDETLASQINDLVSQRLRTFLFTKRLEETACTDGEKTLNDAFGKQSRIVVILFREKWGNTPWTRIEATAIKNRAFEEGYDFTVFIPVDKNARLPKYVPATRLWVDLDRLGVQGAAKVIESRVREAGGDVRQESVIEHAARLKREKDARIDRDKFLHSEEGVKKAQDETEIVLHTIEEMSSPVSAGSGLNLKTNRLDPRVGIGLEICAQYACMQIDWDSEEHTLEGSCLSVRMWNGPFSGRTEEYLRNPNPIEENRYQFDRDCAGALGWRGSDNGELLPSKHLAEQSLTSLLDHAHDRRMRRGLR